MILVIIPGARARDLSDTQVAGKDILGGYAVYYLVILIDILAHIAAIGLFDPFVFAVIEERGRSGFAMSNRFRHIIGIIS